MIEISGFSVERFMNLAVRRGVYLWDVARGGDSAALKVSAAGFKLLKPCAKKTKCKIRIKEKHGFPFLLFRYRKRKTLAFGVVFFVASLFALSSFVWLIEVRGNDRITTAQIMDCLNQNGFAVGALKYNADEKQLEAQLMRTFGDLSWVHIHIAGTKATVTLTETIPKQEIVENNTPCDIVAAQDGLIASIATVAGTPKVKQGDVVQKGDVLVSGTLAVGTEDTGFQSRFVRARAEVRAKMYYEVEFSIPYTYAVKQYTGEKKTDRALFLFGKQINYFLPGVSYTNFDTHTARTQLNFGANYPLPVLAVRTEYREYKWEKRRRAAEEAKQLALAAVTNMIIKDIDFEADIVDKKIDFTEGADSLTVRAVITTIERIDAERAIS